MLDHLSLEVEQRQQFKTLLEFRNVFDDQTEKLICASSSVPVRFARGKNCSSFRPMPTFQNC